jgi:hypothetical protein
MALRVYGIGKSPSGVQYNAAIYDISYSGSESSFDIAKGGIKIEWRGDNDNDVHSPILGSIASIDMLIPVTNTTLNTFVDDVRTSKEGRFLLEIEIQSGAKVWRGIVTPDALSTETDESPVYRCSITAVCGLAMLKKVPYLNAGALYYGTDRLTTHLINALAKLAHVSTFWGTDDAFLETSLDWWATGMTANDANDPLYLGYIDHAAFYNFDKNGSIDDDVLSCYDVLKYICLSFGARIRMRDAVYVVEQIDYRANTTYNWRSYKKSGAQKTYGAYSGVLNVNQTKASASKLTYVTYDYQTQTSKAKAVYEVRLRRNFWQNIILQEGQTYNFNQTISSQSGSLTTRIRGTFFITIENTGYSGSANDIIMPEISMIIKVGSNYLKRDITYSNFSIYYSDAEWSPTSTNRFKLVAPGQTFAGLGESITFIQSFDFITPSLPNDGLSNQVSAFISDIRKNDGVSVPLSEFGISWDAGGLYMEVFDAGTPNVQEDEVLYESDNPDEGTDIWETRLRVGSGSLNYLGAVLNSNATVSYSDWGQGSGTRNKALGALLTKRVQDGRLRVKKRLNGQLYGDQCNGVRKLLSTSDGIDWLDMRVVWSPTENIIDGTWLEMDYGTTSDVKTPVKVKILSGGTNNPTVINPTSTSPTTGGNSPFMANPPGAILNPLSFNSLNTAITKGATVTSISVGTALAGNEFASGDKVKIVNPVTGQFQTFTVASAPSAGATSISVNSATADFDIPQNAGLFVQLTPQAGGGGVADGDKGDITVSSSGTVWTIDNNVISNAKIRQSAALSVVGRSANSTGDVADIAAANSGDVLIRKLSNVLEFGKLMNTSFDDATITSSRLFLNSGVLVGRVLSGSGSGASLNKTQVYSFLGISGAGGRIPIFTAAETISTDADLTYASDRLGAKMYINSGSDLYTAVTFGTGAGTSPTLTDISGGCNFVRVKFTTGTSPSASADVLQITLPVAFLSEQCPVLSAYNANAAGQMANFYTDPTTTTITLKITTALSASTDYDIGFVIFGR